MLRVNLFPKYAHKINSVLSTYNSTSRIRYQVRESSQSHEIKKGTACKVRLSVVWKGSQIVGAVAQQQNSGVPFARYIILPYYCESRFCTLALVLNHKQVVNTDDIHKFVQGGSDVCARFVRPWGKLW
jgi:hypothetical protein